MATAKGFIISQKCVHINKCNQNIISCYLFLGEGNMGNLASDVTFNKF